MSNTMEWSCHEMTPLLGEDHYEPIVVTQPLNRPSLLSSSKGNQKEYNCMIICNYEIPQDTFEFLWKKCTLVICADGGANRLYKYCEKRNTLDYFIPDYIKGDCDSVDQAVNEFYTRNGVTVITDPSQDTTDLMKAMETVREVETDNEITFNNIYVCGGLGGNISHEIANINNLVMNQTSRMILLSPGNIAWLIHPDYTHTIHLKGKVNCSIVPIETVKEVTTTGLRWNLDQHEMKFGAMVSTSNITLDDITTIKTTGILIFIVDLIH